MRSSEHDHISITEHRRLSSASGYGENCYEKFRQSLHTTDVILFCIREASTVCVFASCCLFPCLYGSAAQPASQHFGAGITRTWDKCFKSQQASLTVITVNLHQPLLTQEDCSFIYCISRSTYVILFFTLRGQGASIACWEAHSWPDPTKSHNSTPESTYIKCGATETHLPSHFSHSRTPWSTASTGSSWDSDWHSLTTACCHCFLGQL